MKQDDLCVHCGLREAKADGFCSDDCRIAYAEQQEQEEKDGEENILHEH